jgi:hypothetical protein
MKQAVKDLPMDLMCLYAHHQQEAYYEKKSKVKFAFDYLVHAFKVVICAFIGHDVVDYGYAGPDSGCIDMQCKRCGVSLGHQWLY